MPLKILYNSARKSWKNFALCKKRGRDLTQFVALSYLF